MHDAWLPIGVVLPYAGPLASGDGNGDPATDTVLIACRLACRGWLFCDGSAVSIDMYWELYGVIGTAFGKAPDAGMFLLPDLCGRFIRGVSGARRWRDPDVSTRGHSAPGGNIGNQVGSLQGDAFQLRAHYYNAVLNTTSVPPPVPVPVPVLGPSEANSYGIGQQPTDGVVVSNGVPATATETRPRNLYLNYIVRAR